MNLKLGFDEFLLPAAEFGHPEQSSRDQTDQIISNRTDFEWMSELELELPSAPILPVPEATAITTATTASAFETLNDPHFWNISDALPDAFSHPFDGTNMNANLNNSLGLRIPNMLGQSPSLNPQSQSLPQLQSQQLLQRHSHTETTSLIPCQSPIITSGPSLFKLPYTPADSDVSFSNMSSNVDVNASAHTSFSRLTPAQMMHGIYDAMEDYESVTYVQPIVAPPAVIPAQPFEKIRNNSNNNFNVDMYPYSSPYSTPSLQPLTSGSALAASLSAQLQLLTPAPLVSPALTPTQIAFPPLGPSQFHVLNSPSLNPHAYPFSPAIIPSSSTAMQLRSPSLRPSNKSSPFFAASRSRSSSQLSSLASANPTSPLFMPYARLTKLPGAAVKLKKSTDPEVLLSKKNTRKEAEKVRRDLLKVGFEDLRAELPFVSGKSTNPSREILLENGKNLLFYIPVIFLRILFLVFIYIDRLQAEQFEKQAEIQALEDEILAIKTCF
ncbi:hypothetical protein HK100_006448 [Physocladia obscura]|uniref:BHLH domain-containing protein n=1 Tax=Physocladia obscura TaxID=109957 RepID=A0AAD5SQK1_9FUNG|nr:hypothetical protein HK100_006448 [Physocladia obscura]